MELPSGIEPEIATYQVAVIPLNYRSTSTHFARSV